LIIIDALRRWRTSIASSGWTTASRRTSTDPHPIGGCRRAGWSSLLT